MADTDFVGIDALEAIMDKLKKLPEPAQDDIANDVNEFMLNVERMNPPKHFVTRAAAYPSAPAGPGFFSDAQRRLVMAKWANGEVPYSRTQGISQGWKKLGEGRNAILVNEVPGVVYVKDDKKQANQLRMVGWKTIGQDIKERMPRIMEIADAGIKKAARKLGINI